MHSVVLAFARIPKWIATVKLLLRRGGLEREQYADKWNLEPLGRLQKINSFVHRRKVDFSQPFTLRYHIYFSVRRWTLDSPRHLYSAGRSPGWYENDESDDLDV